MKKFKDFIELDELSVKKLLKYGKAAHKDIDNQMNNRDDKKVMNRVKGKKLAGKKILGGAKVAGRNFIKNEETVNELSKGTLRKYFTGSYNDSTERRGKTKDTRDISAADKKKEASRNKYRTIAARKISPKPKSVSAKGAAGKAKYQFKKDTETNESVDIQELSSKTLANYITKSKNDSSTQYRKFNNAAGKSYGSKDALRRQHSRDAGSKVAMKKLNKKDPGETDKATSKYPHSDNDTRKVAKHATPGIENQRIKRPKGYNKKTNESVEIQELSAPKLADYSAASRNDALDHSRFRKRNTTPADEKRVKKRMKGDKLAGKKLDRIYKSLGK